MLLGRPWLYMAQVVVDLGEKEFRVVKPMLRISWLYTAYEGETHETDGYTTEWSDTEDSSTQVTYLVSEFSGLVEQDFEFLDFVAER